jgi:hypothetical protein
MKKHKAKKYIQLPNKPDYEWEKKIVRKYKECHFITDNATLIDEVQGCW